MFTKSKHGIFDDRKIRNRSVDFYWKGEKIKGDRKGRGENKVVKKNDDREKEGWRDSRRERQWIRIRFQSTNAFGLVSGRKVVDVVRGLHGSTTLQELSLRAKGGEGWPWGIVRVVPRNKINLFHRNNPLNRIDELFTRRHKESDWRIYLRISLYFLLVFFSFRSFLLSLFRFGSFSLELNLLSWLRFSFAPSHLRLIEFIKRICHRKWKDLSVILVSDLDRGFRRWTKPTITDCWK